MLVTAPVTAARAFVLAFLVLACGVAIGCDSGTSDIPEADLPEPGLALVSFLDPERNVRAVGDTERGCYYHDRYEYMVPVEGSLQLFADQRLALMVVFRNRERPEVEDTLRFEGVPELHGRIRLLQTAEGDTLVIALGPTADQPTQAVVLDLNMALAPTDRFTTPCSSFRFAAEGVSLETFAPGEGESGTFDAVMMEPRYPIASGSQHSTTAVPGLYPGIPPRRGLELLNGTLYLSDDGDYLSHKETLRYSGGSGGSPGTYETKEHIGSYVKGGKYFMFDPLGDPNLGIEEGSRLRVRGALYSYDIYPDHPWVHRTLWMHTANMWLERRSGG